MFECPCQQCSSFSGEMQDSEENFESEKIERWAVLENFEKEWDERISNSTQILTF